MTDKPNKDRLEYSQNEIKAISWIPPNPIHQEADGLYYVYWDGDKDRAGPFKTRNEANLVFLKYDRDPDTKDHLVGPAGDGRWEHYVLDDNGEAVEWHGTLLGWCDVIDRLGKDAWLKTTELPDGNKVITKFLGMDHLAMSLIPADKPGVFGTIAWNQRDEFFDATRAEAMARHERVVDKLQQRRSLKDEYE
jgi:hypothetical protein